MVQLHDLKFTPFISESQITEAIESVAERLNRDYEGRTPVFLGVLNGAFLFAAELVKRFRGNCEVSFVKLSSYQGTSATGSVEELVGLNQSLEGREVVVIEDIVDTGNTLVRIDSILRKEGV